MADRTSSWLPEPEPVLDDDSWPPSAKSAAKSPVIRSMMDGGSPGRGHPDDDAPALADLAPQQNLADRTFAAGMTPQQEVRHVEDLEHQAAAAGARMREEIDRKDGLLRQLAEMEDAALDTHSSNAGECGWPPPPPPSPSSLVLGGCARWRTAVVNRLCGSADAEIMAHNAQLQAEMKQLRVQISAAKAAAEEAVPKEAELRGLLRQQRAANDQLLDEMTELEAENLEWDAKLEALERQKDDEHRANLQLLADLARLKATGGGSGGEGGGSTATSAGEGGVQVQVRELQGQNEALLRELARLQDESGQHSSVHDAVGEMVRGNKELEQVCQSPFNLLWCGAGVAAA
eukprot:SAG22_NODE_7_length_40155_cov_25.241356_14_plen_346_part_00